MHGITNFEFLVGVAVGKIMLGALFASPLFRNLALAVAAIGVCFLYLQKGVSGIILIAHTLHSDLFIRPDFSKGLVVGAILAFFVFGLYRRSRTS